MFPKSHPISYLKFSLLCSVLILGVATARSQTVADSDTVTTPFRKGRWLTGIAGSINSTTNEFRSNDAGSTSNEYAINIIGGNFVKDRWLVGGIIQMQRSNADGLANLTNETLFIGPTASHYFSDAERGSLFLSLAPGYARYQNLIRIEEATETSEEKSEGSGFGLFINLGYSYVIIDRIAFDIGVGLGQQWFNVERSIDPGNISFEDDISLRNVSFTFGFRILLDKFLP